MMAQISIWTLRTMIDHRWSAMIELRVRASDEIDAAKCDSVIDTSHRTADAALLSMQAAHSVDT